MPLLQLGSRGPAVLALNERFADLRCLRSGQVPPWPACAGCVRVPPPFAREVLRFAQIGVPVVVR